MVRKDLLSQSGIPNLFPLHFHNLCQPKQLSPSARIHAKCPHAETFSCVFKVFDVVLCNLPRASYLISGCVPLTFTSFFSHLLTHPLPILPLSSLFSLHSLSHSSSKTFFSRFYCRYPQLYTPWAPSK